jgi:hypothetical protein
MRINPFATAVSLTASLGTALAVATVPAAAAVGYDTYHFNNDRTGWNPNETILTAAAVSSGHFHLLRFLAADSVVYAQPLYAPGVTVGATKHNLAIVASENDSVYAYDADSGKLVWKRSFISPSAGITAVSVNSVGGCGQITPTIGISSTPAIDPTTNTLYLDAKIQIIKGSATTYEHQIHAIALSTGADRVAPVVVAATVRLDDGTMQSFGAQWQQNRAGLLLSRGAVYVGFGSSCDQHGKTVHGWIFAFDKTTLRTLAVLNTARSSSESSLGSVWQGTYALAADAYGSVYFTTGNGSFDADSGGSDFGESIVRATPSLTIADYFSPFDESTQSDEDQDIGSVGVMLLPSVPGSSAQLAISGIKSGTMFLLDRADLGRFNASADRSLQDVTLENNPNSLYGGPAYYNGFVYWGAGLEPMKAFALHLGAHPSLTLSSQTANSFPGEGGEIPSVSSNGTVAGSAVVWATTRAGQGGTIEMYAYDARNLGRLLWHGEVGIWRASGDAFLTPTVADGHVFVGGSGYGVAEYGLR